MPVMEGARGICCSRYGPLFPCTLSVLEKEVIVHLVQLVNDFVYIGRQRVSPRKPVAAPPYFPRAIHNMRADTLRSL